MTTGLTFRSHPCPCGCGEKKRPLAYSSAQNAAALDAACKIVTVICRDCFAELPDDQRAEAMANVRSLVTTAERWSVAMWAFAHGRSGDVPGSDIPDRRQLQGWLQWFAEMLVYAFMPADNWAVEYIAQMPRQELEPLERVLRLRGTLLEFLDDLGGRILARGAQ